MKRLNDYIIEKQQINEAGLRDTLFGEIVMKLLGTGLDWIGKGVGWIADSLKGAAAEGWKSFSGINDDAWFGWRKRSHYNGDMPKNEKEFIQFINDYYISNTDESIESRYETLIEMCRQFKFNNDTLAKMALPMLSAYGENKKASKEDTQKAIEYLKKLINLNGISANTKKQINTAITKLEKKIKQ